MTKDELQDKALELSIENRNLMITFATGVGKTLAALKIMKHFGGRWYIVVPEIPMIKTWHDEIVKHKMEDLFLSLDIFCYDSLHKYQEKVTGIVLDEAHHATTDIRLRGLMGISCEHIIGLTASITSTQISTLEFMFGDFYVFDYSLSEAINDEILPEPKVFILGKELDGNALSHIYTIKRGIAKLRTSLQCTYADMMTYLVGFPHIELAISCTAQQKYDLLTNEVTYAKEKFFEVNHDMKVRQSTKDFLKNRWLNAGSTRKRFLSELKTEEAKNIVNKLMFERKRFICFTGSIAQAKQLSPSELCVVNSEKDKKENGNIISNFNDKIINSIFVTGMLKEGANLENIEAGIIIQLDNQIKSFVQRTGRVLRADDPIVYILYVKGTQDEKYLESALEGFDQNYVKYVDNFKEL